MGPLSFVWITSWLQSFRFRYEAWSPEGGAAFDFRQKK
jgi:hypothetical protein